MVDDRELDVTVGLLFTRPILPRHGTEAERTELDTCWTGDVIVLSFIRDLLLSYQSQDQQNRKEVCTLLWNCPSRDFYAWLWLHCLGF